MEVITILIAVVGGFVAGIINTLAGNGSAITLSILTEVLGLPGNLANGTNRVGIFFQSAASGTAFYRNDKLDLYRSKCILILTCPRAIIGGLVATQVCNEFFISVYKFFMVIMLIVILVKPKRWLRETDLDNQIPLWLKAPIFLALGFYGGFIQMGMGVFFLAVMVLVARYSIIEANAVKIFVVMLYTIFVNSRWCHRRIQCSTFPNQVTVGHQLWVCEGIVKHTLCSRAKIWSQIGIFTKANSIHCASKLRSIRIYPAEKDVLSVVVT